MYAIRSYYECYYPKEFMAALLTSERDNTDKVVKYIDEAKRMGIELSPPDINRSYMEFSPATIDGNDLILFGLGAIRITSYNVCYTKLLRG